jgi:ketosteroid isomerase-like protein
MSDQNVKVIERAWDAFVRGDVEGATQDAAPEAQWVLPETLPWGGTHIGRDGFLTMIGNLNEHFEKLRIEPELILDAGETHVVAIEHEIGHTKAGGDIDSRGVWVYELEGGELRRAQYFGDTAAFRAAVQRKPEAVPH